MVFLFTLSSWWIQMAYAMRRCDTIDKAEAILLRAQEIHPKNVITLLNLASYASLTGRVEEAKSRLRHAIDLNKGARRLALDVEDLRAAVGLDQQSGLDLVVSFRDGPYDAARTSRLICAT
jgi:Flp pilus assembly protein TadD